MSDYYIMAPCPANTVQYTIKSGDTLTAIARKYNTTVAAIEAANPGIDPRRLQIGQVICVPQAAPSGCPAGSTQYTVVSGDTLTSIAKKYNTTVAAIVAANPGINPNLITVGQKICIPGPAPGTCPSGTTQYTVVAGDTLTSIAAKYNTSVSAIVAANPGINPNLIIVGQKICVPTTAAACPPGTTSYTVVSGDTLTSIAAKYGTTVSAILSANPGIDPNRLMIGQKICIPAAAPTCPPNTKPYTVVAGDTLYSIARKFGTSVASIEAANPGIDPNRLMIGQTICVPMQPYYPPCPNGQYYVVQRGDTMYSIAQRYGVSLNDLQAANPQAVPTMLSIGQVLCIPKTPSTVNCPPGAYQYRIVQGDTLYGIAQRYGVSLAALLAVNPDIDPNALIIGQIICIPG